MKIVIQDDVCISAKKVLFALLFFAYSCAVAPDPGYHIEHFGFTNDKGVFVSGWVDLSTGAPGALPDALDELSAATDISEALEALERNFSRFAVDLAEKPK